MRIVFDENTPKSVAHAIKLLAEPEFSIQGETLQILHALDLIAAGTADTTLIQSVADGTHAKSALITTDKSMRTRHHERAAFHQSGCIGIILRQNWNHASLWARRPPHPLVVANLATNNLHRRPWYSLAMPLVAKAQTAQTILTPHAGSNRSSSKVKRFDPSFYFRQVMNCSRLRASLVPD